MDGNAGIFFPKLYLLPPLPPSYQVVAVSQKEMRDRIASVASTRKITEAMKLVAAAKVRRAQDAVINARPFSESLVKVLFAINTRLAGEQIDVPLCQVRPVKTVSFVSR